MKYYASFSITAKNALLNRAMNYGDGVFETILISGKKIPLWSYHYQRLNDGLKALQIDPVSEKTLLKHLLSLSTTMGEYIAKLVVFRNDLKRGYGSEASDSHFYMIVSDYLPSNTSKKISISPIRLAHQPALAKLKHLNRLEQVLASNCLKATDYDDAIMLDYDDHVIETTKKNILLIKDDKIYSPKLDKCGIHGVALRWLHDQGYQLNWKRIEFKSLSQYHGFMVCNGIQGFSEVNHINGELTFNNTCDLINDIKLRWQKMINHK